MINNKSEQNTDTFTIYQLKDVSDTRYFRFEPLDAVKAAGQTVEQANYMKVYTGELPKMGSTNEKLEALYLVFNQNRPEDFHGHSLSVSDVVALNIGGKVSCHYVDRVGFQELPGFLDKERRPSLREQLKANPGAHKQATAKKKCTEMER